MTASKYKNGANSDKATAYDFCDESPIDVTSSDVVTGAAPGDHSLARTWSATDSCGNVGQDVQTITFEDRIPPWLSLPEDATITCFSKSSPDYLGKADAVDNCEDPSDKPDTKVSFSDELIYRPGTQIVTGIRRKWKATDVSHNSASDYQTITVTPTDPQFDGNPSDQITLQCPEQVDSLPTLSATDSCGNEVTTTFTDQKSGSCPTVITRTWSATDSQGLTGTFVQTITVSDTIPPTLSIPGNKQVECLADIGTSAAVTVWDNCKGVGNVTFNDVTQTTKCPIQISRTWSVLDACSNPASVVQVITVRKQTTPTLSVPPNMLVNCGAATTADTTGTGTATAVDVCGNSLTTKYTDSKVMLKNRTAVISRKWQVSDDCQNSDTKTQTITIRPDEPVFNVPNDYEAVCGEDLSTSRTGVATATAQCGTVTVSYSDSKTCPAKSGSVTRQWSVSDESGVLKSKTQKITSQNCNPFGDAIQGISSVTGSKPFMVRPSITITDMDFPCETVTLVWTWEPGVSTTQVCDPKAPSECNFDSSTKTFTASTTYSYKSVGTFSVQLLVYDTRANLPKPLPVVTAGSPVAGQGWVMFGSVYLSVFDASVGFITGGVNMDLSGATINGQTCDEDNGKSSCGFNARFITTGNTLAPAGNLECQFMCSGLPKINFKSTAYDNLTVYATNPPTARFTGVGTVGGTGNYRFTVFLNDDGNNDRLRIRVEDPSNKNVIADNLAQNTNDITILPDASLLKGSVKIHNPSSVTISALNAEDGTSVQMGSGITTSASVIAAVVEGIVILILIAVIVIVVLRNRKAASSTTTAPSDNFVKM